MNVKRMNLATRGTFREVGGRIFDTKTKRLFLGDKETKYITTLLMRQNFKGRQELTAKIFDTSNKNTISANKMEIDIMIFSLASAGR